MIIEVIMKRKLFGQEISQKSKSEFFSATDLVRAGNKWRVEHELHPFDLSSWLQTKSAKEFINALKSHYGQVIISGRGRGKHTWVHPFLFIDIALAINPQLKIEVYSWLYDHLLEYRNVSGDTYKIMCGALYQKYKNKSEFPNFIKEVARKIQNACGINDWQQSTEKQLKLRDKIHENISFLSDIMTDPKQIVKIAIDKTLKNNRKLEEIDG